MFALILFCGILLPSGIGYAMDKMDGVAVHTLMASSVDENNSVFLSQNVDYRDGVNSYTQDVVAMGGYDYYMVSKNNPTPYTGSPIVYGALNINNSMLNGVDKIVVKVRCVDDNKLCNGSWVYFTGTVGKTKVYSLEYDNSTGFWTAEIPVTPDIILKKPNAIILHFTKFGVHDNDIVGKTFQYRIEAYDIKGINSMTMKNIFLGFSGALLLIAGLCATPWINPTKWYHQHYSKRRRR
jgi:hypothetical protein